MFPAKPALHQHSGLAGAHRRLGLGLGGKAFEVKGSGVEDLSEHVIPRGACGHTAGQIAHLSREVVISFFDHNGKGLAHGRSAPDRRAMLLRVPLAVRAAVTRPGRCGCLVFLWLPLITARIFTKWTGRWLHALSAELAKACIRGITESSRGSVRMKILLTGTAGRLGQALRQLLQAVA